MNKALLFAGAAAAAFLSLHSHSAHSVSASVTVDERDDLDVSADATCSAFRDVVVDVLVHQSLVGYGYGYNPYGYYGGVGLEADVDAVPMPSSARGERSSTAPTTPGAARARGPARGPAAGPSHHTTTNVQERGVDEADIVKTDGRHVYVLQANELVIAKTWPVARSEFTARVQFTALQPQALYLHGDEVVVQGYAYDPTGQQGWPQGRTRLLFVDVKDRKAPKVKRTVDVEGGTLATRMIGDDVYLVQNNYLQMPARLTKIAQETIAKLPRTEQYTLRPWDVQARLAETLRATLHDEMTIDDVRSMLPRVQAGSDVTRMSCSDVHVPSATAAMQLGMTTLARVGARSEANDVDLIGALVSGGQVYASTSELYVAAPSYRWDRRGVASYNTQVHQFSLGDRTKQQRPRYVASGAVPGMVLNTFSMDEHRGDLRIATTDWSWNGQQGGNHLFVMRPDAQAKRLRTIGAIRGIAKGERIFSGRLLGDKGYLVTFRQTDPLFTLDLSDPKNPRVVGELKVNGYSSYIHPLDDDLLLTIGQDATDQGRITGLHLQIFDVRNPAKPIRRHHEKLIAKHGHSYAYSMAEHDHHAFTYDPVTRTLAIPLNSYDGSYSRNALAVFTIDPVFGFRSKGTVDHASLVRSIVDEQCVNQKRDVYGCRPQDVNMYLGSYPVMRSMIVDKYIVSMSNAGLAIHELDGLDVAAKLSFTELRKKSATPIALR